MDKESLEKEYYRRIDEKEFLRCTILGKLIGTINSMDFIPASKLLSTLKGIVAEWEVKSDDLDKEISELNKKLDNMLV